MRSSGRMTTLEERVTIVELARNGWSDAQIAVHLGWREATVRKWRLRGRQGREALTSPLGRPARGAWVPDTLRERTLRAVLRQQREAHPGWGPKTLLAELARAPEWAGCPLPSRATVARYLRQEGLTRTYARHTELPVVPRRRPQAPHEEWEMDARGQEPVPDLGVVTLVHLNDRYSHVRLLSYPFVLGDRRAARHLQTEDYQLALRLAFRDWGLPDRLAVDHESVFYDNESPSPFPSRLQLWLQALGVDLIFGRVRQPTDQGLTERSHQLWAAQVLAGQRFAHLEALLAALRERRTFLNEHLPCRTLGELPPLRAYPQARRPRRPYAPEEERGLLVGARIWEYLGRCRWFRRVSSAHTVSLGGQVYYLGTQWTPGQQVELRGQGTGPTLVVGSEDGQQQQELALRGLTPAELMGDWGRILGVPGYQLSLPFTTESERELRLCETLG